METDGKQTLRQTVRMAVYIKSVTCKGETRREEPREWKEKSTFLSCQILFLNRFFFKWFDENSLFTYIKFPETVSKITP